MSTAIRQISLLVAKDLRIESRSRQTVGLVTVLGVLIVVVLGLGLGTGSTLPGYNATAVLWVAYLFAGVLCFEKTMAVERHDSALAGLMLAPMDRGHIYLSKLLSNLLLMFAVALVITPAGVLFFGFDLSAAPGTFAGIMVLSMIGFAAVGTLFAAIVSSTRLQGGLLAMMIFPVALPLVIASTQMMIKRYRDGIAPEAGSIGILVAFDAIFLVVSWVVFEWVLEP
ncbi:MAG TPA: heme exporter protein CcmB [Tepidisphaeraceae bacterium]|jgi:heme exporter protein B